VGHSGAIAALLREIVDAATRVHETLGPGFLERVYARALLSELRSRGLAIERERQIKIWYGSQVVGKHALDLIVERTVVVELKANHGLASIHAAQLRSYLQAADCSHGILLNFGARALQWEVLHRELVAEKPE
jgi:GxxExxY protein